MIVSFVGVIILAFFLYQSCGKEKAASAAYNNIKDTLQYVLDDTARVHGEARRLKYENDDLDRHISDLVADLQLTRGALIDESDKVLWLSSEVKKAKANKDTARYIEKCDSLADEYAELNNYVNDLIGVHERVNAVVMERIKKSDSLSKHWESAYIQCKNAVVVAVTELPKIEPKGKMYIDITGMTGPVTAVGGGFGYMDKNGRMISGDVLISGHGPIYQLRLSAPLSLKRKN